MNTRSNHFSIALCALALSLTACGSARADGTVTPDASAPAAAVSLHVSQDTQMPDVIKMVSDETGTALIADKSVFATVGTVSINKMTLPAVFKFLKTQEPGLSWQRVFIPADQPIPDGDTLYQQMQTLKAVSLSGLVVPSDTGTLSFHKEAADASKPTSPPSPVPSGMREAYLFTDEVLRAKTAAHRSDEAKAQAAQAPAQRFTDNVSSLASDFSQLTPAEQQAMLPMLMGDMRQLMQNMDPAARQAMMQQQRQQRQQQRQSRQQNQQGQGGGD